MKCYNWNTRVEHVMGSSPPQYRNKLGVAILSPQNKGIMVSSCCGSMFVDLEGKNEPIKLYGSFSMEKGKPPKEMSQAVMGVGVWVNATGIIPDSGEDDKYIYDSVLIDGEKLILQYRKCE